MSLKTLPQKSFNFNYTSDIDGKSYVGTFVFRRKVISDEAKIRVRQVQLNGGLHYDAEHPGVGIDPNTDGLNYMIATLDVLTVQKPDWFDTDELFDANIIVELYKEVKAFQNSFRKQSVPVADRSSESRSEKAQAEPDESGSIAHMVFAQVPATLEPR